MLALGWIWPAAGRAYCRTTTIDSVPSGCPEVCQTQGLPLYWPTRDISYILNERGFPDLPEASVRQILERSFSAWAQVSCDGTSIDLAITQEPGTTTLEVGPRLAEPNDNVIVHFPASEWDDDPRAFAITKIWYNKKNGHILGADMQFNGAMDPFGVCPDTGGCRGDSVTDLRNVVTHEAGHFLGLAHSDVATSTMWCDAAPGDVDKRDLDEDDTDGLCAIYGPNAEPDPDLASESLTRRSGSCSAAPSAADGRGAWLVLALAAGLTARARRRRGDRAPDAQ